MWVPATEVPALLDSLARHKDIGFDTETVGCNPAEESPALRARCHVWSLAVFSGKYSPRGYKRATGYVLPGSTLPQFTKLLGDGRRIYAHNASYDMHVLENSLGAELPEGDYRFVDTLTLARWRYPGRMQYGLKSLAQEILGRTPGGMFKELFSRPLYRHTEKRIKVCSCGEAYRSITEHRKAFPTAERKTHVDNPAGRVSVITVIERSKRELLDISDIVPGHSLWNTLVEYAAEDAEWALELASAVSREMKQVPARPEYGGIDAAA